MDGPRFDAWTRRRLGLTAGGAIASVLGLATPKDTEADRRKHARNLPCRKLKARCSPKKGSKYDKARCCDKINRLHCDRGPLSGSYRCCYDVQQVCSGDSTECCRDLRCGAISGLSGSRCCAGLGGACATSGNCCDSVPCEGGICNLPVTSHLPPPSPCVASDQPCPGACFSNGECPGCCTGECASTGLCGTLT